MKKISFLLFISLLIVITGCNNKSVKETNNNSSKSNEIIESSDNVENINIIINGKIYILNLEDNETVLEFIKLLPLEYNMSELNGNEKYVYMDNSLTANKENIGHIEKGDVMLYQNNCLVIFYKSFDTSYSYTRIGHINDLDDLGNGNIFVKFEIAKK